VFWRSRPFVTITMSSVLAPALLMAQGGPTDRQKIDAAAAQRGRAVYAAQCINCHGSTAKGGPNGPDLIRSPAVLRDRAGSHIGPAIRAAASSHPGALTADQLRDVSHFLRDRVEAVTRNRTPTAPIDVLTGDPEAGRVYFNGAGRCSTCLFPALGRSAKQVEVTVTPPAGPPVSGTLVRIDNFTVSLRDASGDYRSFSRGPGVMVDVRDPLTVHRELLDHYTDEAIHDVVAYLWTIK
jgi:mono/diheme cytochrome c family protein